MTLTQWLAEMRRPEMCGINARAYLKGMVGTSGAPIHAKVNINAVGAAINALCNSLALK